MLYLDYAKPLADGKYILSFFADSVADLESISHGQKFVTKNGTDYGVPQAGSTVIVTSPNSGKTTYVMDAEGIWVVTEDISYSAVVANPSDAATAKLEKLKVNDTTYANWTENEIKSIASESGGSKLYKHYIDFRLLNSDSIDEYEIFFIVYAATSEPADTISKFRELYDTYTPTCIVNRRGGPDALGVGYLTNLLDDSSYPELCGYLGSWTPVSNMAFPNIYIDDTVTEL